jgi:YYY domain-containing protein
MTDPFGLVFVWWATFVILGILGLPVVGWLCASVPGRGAGFALPASLVLVTLTAYWVGHLAFGWIALGAGLLVLVVVSALAATRVDDVDWRAAAEAGVVFTVAFVGYVALVSTSPEIQPVGSEDFLDFGLLKSLGRASTLPPESMWFAGESVEYYYGGQLVGALLSMLTGTAPRYGYNLAVAGVGATLATGAYELAGAVAASRGESRRLAGAAGVFFVGLASNVLDAAKVSVWTVLTVFPAPVRDSLAASVAGVLGTTPEQLLRHPVDRFGYWNATRVMGDNWTEFPLFAFLHGDLHAYVVSAPFLLLVVALAHGYFCTPADELSRRRVLVFGAIPAVAGLVALTNTWGFPTTAGVTALSVAFAPARPATLLPGRLRDRLDGTGAAAAEARRFAVALGVAVGTGLVAVALASPFLLSVTGGSERVALVPAAARSGLFGLLVIHGGFLAVFVVYLSDRTRAGQWSRWWTAAVGLGSVAPAVVLAVLLDVPAVALFVPLLIVAWALLRTARWPVVSYETVLLVAGLGLVLLVEFAYVVEPNMPLRVNTVFKTYFQVWILWGVAAGVMFPAVVRPIARSPDRAEASDVSRPVVAATLPPVPVHYFASRSTWERALRLLLAVAVVASMSTYGALALTDRLASTGDPTLDGLRYAEQSRPAEMEAIQWLGAREGRPTMVSAPSLREQTHRWRANPASSLTGVPTVVGWADVADYREPPPYHARVADVETIYTGTPARRVALLRQYDVRYVYVGPKERGRYDVRPFDRLEGVSVAFENEEVTVYRVSQERLAVPAEE